MISDISITAAPLRNEQKQSLIAACAFMALATVAMLPNFILGALFGAMGLGFIAIITIGGMYLSFEFAFALLVICLFLQNLFIAIVIPLMPGIDQFTPLLATSFINIMLSSCFAAVMWFSMRNGLPKDNRALMRSLVLFFAVITFYSVIGALQASLADALVYMRVYLAGGLLLIIGIAFGFRLAHGFTANVLRAMAFFLVLWGVLEFFFTYELYTIFHIADYIHFKYTTSESTDVNNVQQAIEFASRSYLNLSGSLGLNIDLLRPQGPNVHPISYAYALAFGALVTYINRSFVLTAACLALLVLVGAKGPLIMAFLSIVLSVMYVFSRRTSLLLITLAACLVFYAVIGIAYGIYTEDYHVIGFMGGVKGFLANPLGRGVGVGGNLSNLAMEHTNFSLFQGYGATFALESGFGVMIYQIGIGTAVFLLFYWRLWRSVLKAVLYFSAEPRLIVIPCALAILLVNSIFQEEAFSPAGWGPLMLLSGLLLARYWQKSELNEAVHI